MEMFVVMGAGGNTGRNVTAGLLRAGRGVRAIGRSPERLRTAERLGAEVRVGDARDVAFLTEAMTGAEGAYVLMPFDPFQPGYVREQAALGETITEAIRRSGIPRVVALSSLGAEIAAGTGFLTSLHDQEARLRALPDVDVTLLRPGLYFQSFLPFVPSMREHGVHLDTLAPEVAIPMVDPADVGAVGAAALLAGAGNGVSVREVPGPRDLSVTEAVRILGPAIGVPELDYQQVDDDTMTGLLLEAGLPPDVVRLQLEMNAALSTGVARRHEERTGDSGSTGFEDFAASLRTLLPTPTDADAAA